MRDDRLRVLADIARRLNEAGVIWAVGGSLMLCFHGKADTFHDIDILTTDADFPRAAEALESLGASAPKPPSPRFATRHIRAFAVDGVDIDLIAGLVIVADGARHDRSLDPADIAGDVEVFGERVPLHSLAVWRENYRLMGRQDKARMLDE